MAKPLSIAPLIEPSASVRESRLGMYTEVGARTCLLEVELGDYSYVVNDSDIAYTTIGKFCSIAAMTRGNPGNHPMDRASQSHFSYRASAYFPGETDELEFFQWRRSHPVTIGHDVWIGHGAIVTKNVPSYSIVAGNPALIIRQRFPDSTAERLQRLAWWDWSRETLRSALPDFRKLTVEDFLNKYERLAAAA